MKKLLTIALLLIWGISHAQNYNQSWSKRDKLNYKFVAFGFDVRNAVIGSKPTNNKPELNYQFKLGAVSKNVEVAIFYEQFKRIDFQAYGVNVGYILPVAKKTDLYAGIETGSIIRYKTDNFLMYGFNGELRQHIGKNFIIGLQANYRYRSDIDQKNGENDFRFSAMANFIYELFN